MESCLSFAKIATLYSVFISINVSISIYLKLLILVLFYAYNMPCKIAYVVTVSAYFRIQGKRPICSKRASYLCDVS